MSKRIIFSILIGFVSVSNAGNVPVVTKDLILKGINAPSDSSQLKVMENFSQSMTSFCRGSKLPSCSFSDLFEMYKTNINSLQNPELSGLELAKVPGFQNSFAPLPLNSGTWTSVPFVFADGAQTATRLILTRIALEKSLLAHKNYLNQSSSNGLNIMATFGIQQMISSLSGFSKALKALKYAEHFNCSGSPDLPPINQAT